MRWIGFEKKQLTKDNFHYFFTENVKALRSHRKQTQAEFAEFLGIKRTTIGAIEEGRSCGIENVYIVSRKCGYSMDDLLTKILPF